MSDTSDRCCDDSGRIFGNHFSGAIEQCGMRDAGQNWLIQGNTFEPLRPVGATNPVGAYTQSYGSVNVVFDSNWFGDGTNGTSARATRSPTPIA